MTTISQIKDAVINQLISWERSQEVYGSVVDPSCGGGDYTCYMPGLTPYDANGNFIPQTMCQPGSQPVVSGTLNGVTYRAACSVYSAGSGADDGSGAWFTAPILIVVLSFSQRAGC